MRCGFALAVKAIIFKDDKFLVLRRSEKEMKSSYLNKYEHWDLPGGSVYFHENSTEGLYREIYEETALNVKLIKPIRVFDVIKKQMHMTIITYMCQYGSGEVVLSEEHEEYFWLTLKEAEEMKVPKWMLKDIKSVIDEMK